ncbi:hypothetical protein UlMin_001598 [Ulmus minor]
MDKRFNGPTGPSSSIDGGIVAASGSQLRQTKFSSRAVQVALEHLASIDLVELCNEAKVERCRATRDLRSCGRPVDSALNSCGHASLCPECSERCDLCPICRIPMPKIGDKLHLRLFYELIEAGLISKRYDDRFQDKEDGEGQMTADVQRLYALFDVALENSLVALICHYVTDVCMDESAVSSDPVVAFLLDEVVVKDWCKRTFGNIIADLQVIYNLEAVDMKTRLSTLLKYSAQLVGISNVVEVLESSFRGSLSAQLHDLHLLQESILKIKQHMEIMIWCIRHQFLENVRSRYANFTSWRSLVRERKSAAIRRSWPDAVNNSEECAGQEGSLFIEDALANLEIEHGYTQEREEELKIAYLQKDGVSSIFRSKIEGIAGCYPFESLRAAIDILFLRGSSDMVLAKQAIFLYYLFDRHWTTPNEGWRHIVEDFAASFGITRHLLLESLIFYLLDDHSDESMLEASHLLPEISGPTTHPKIAQVLLERGNPDAALLVLRWSGHDGVSQFISLREAVTSVRVRVECGLLTEAFLHQRMLCTKVREKKLKYRLSADAPDCSIGEHKSSMDWMDILVTEICYLCIRRNMVDRIIELPWNSDEEKHLHKCLLDYATGDPSSTVGSLLVVFYIQRYRYSEAHQVNQILKNVEQEFLSKHSSSDEVISRMRLASGLRTGFVEKALALLPEVQRQEVRAGKLPEFATTGDEVEVPGKSGLPKVQFTKSTSLLIPTSNDSSISPLTYHTAPNGKPSSFETPIKRGGSFDNYQSELGKSGSSILQARLFNTAERGANSDVSMSKNLKFGDQLSQSSQVKISPLKDQNRSSPRVLPNRNVQDNQPSKLSPENEMNRFIDQIQNGSPYSGRFTANPVTTPSSVRGLLKDYSQDLQPSVTSKRAQPERDVIPLNMVSDDLMEVTWSSEKKDPAGEDIERNANGGPRWRSDETSDEEQEQIPERTIGMTLRMTPARRARRSRFAKR